MQNTLQDIKQRNQRIQAAMAVLAAIGIVIALRFFHLQVIRYEPDPGGVAAAPLDIEPRRGRIYDATGHLLAVDQPLYHICCNPYDYQDSQQKIAFARQVGPIIGMAESDVVREIDQAITTDQHNKAEIARLKQAGEDLGRLANWPAQKKLEYLRLATYLTADQVDALPEGAGVFTETMMVRAYPQAKLAAHVLGFVAWMANGENYYGIEQYYSKELTGKPGHTWPHGTSDSGGARIVPAVNGMDVGLTINRAVQYETERVLRDTVQREQADGGTIIVMDPRTGAILAMANEPTFDPNHYGDYPAESLANTAISEPYEPGSVFKIITMAAALDSGTVSKNDTFYDHGKIDVGGEFIMNHDRQAYGPSTMTELMVHSLNVGAVYLAKQMGGPTFYEYVHRFGFGQITDIDLANENAGQVRTPGDPNWYEVDLGTHAFGQGLDVTALQMISAVSAVANDGLRMKPYVVKEIRGGDEIQTIAPKSVRQVIEPEVAHDLTDMLVATVRNAYPQAAPAGYTVAGKTGTAQIIVGRAYAEAASAVVASFVGYCPANDPRFVVLVKLDRPKVNVWGSTAAVPAFRALAERLVALLDVPPDAQRYVR